MPSDRKQLAFELRKSGKSIKSIASEVGAAPSSVSTWVRGITLTDQQIKKLKANTHSPETIEKRRQARLKSELAKRTAVIESSRLEVGSLSRRELWLIGVSLYWAEGGKTQSIVRFSNGDPRMILLMMRFFREVCLVDESKLRGYIHIHEHLDTIAAENYWQKITGLPATQFYKTYNKPSKSSKGTRDSLPYGVCDIYISDYKLFLRIMGWIEGIYDSSFKLI